MGFYGPSGELLRQGDILYPIPFPLLPLQQEGLPDTAISLIDLEQLNGKPTCTLDITADVAWGIVITQTCDLTDRSSDNILVARIYKASEKFKDFPQDGQALSARLSEFKNSGKKPKYFYLPKNEEVELEQSVVYLLETQAFSAKNRPALLKSRRASLSDLARAAMQERLAYTFGRVALPDDFYLDLP